MAVHPRLRGELRSRPAVLSLRIGSSPLARGTGRRDDFLTKFDRFIPACAGNSTANDDEIQHLTVHPRLCGELKHCLVTRNNFPGSSPLARGTPTGEPGIHELNRFIPACAGNSSCVKDCEQGSSVHPRLRGELWFPLP